MCGIVGYIASDGNAFQLQQTLVDACNTLTHRGPDEFGVWFDQENGVGLGHRRLSILDISSMGMQPMLSSSGRYVISYNGEVYNFQELKYNLTAKGCKFRGNSDTEVLLAGFETWGVVETIKRSIGMFAFGLWDSQERIAYLARDRMGVKPLYYGRIKGGWAFASELKALRALPGFEENIQVEAVALLLQFGYIPAPYTIYQQAYKLLPGSILRLPVDKLTNIPDLESYWTIRQAAEKGLHNPFRGSDEEAIMQMDELLLDAVRLRMIADVPLGAFLSGGIDSSLVVALMQAQSTSPVKTFTIGFRESSFDEAAHASVVAKHLNVEHTQLYLSPQEAMDVIPDLPTLYDEPFGDSSQIPTYLVSKLARSQVTVSLSGDGGDELLWGYTRYPYTLRAWNNLNFIPQRVRQLLTRIPQPFSLPLIRDIGNIIGRWIIPSGKNEPLSDKINKVHRMADFDNEKDLYLKVISFWDQPDHIFQQSYPNSFILPDANLNDLAHWMMFVDQMLYLPDDILVKVDRASMGVSLEAREPLLDHRLVEFSWRLPFYFKYRNGEQKWLLKQILYRYVPRNLVDRPKSGFAIPISEWLRGPLKDWANDLLDERAIHDYNILNPQPIHQVWKSHLNRQIDGSYYLWPILMFQAWLKKK